MYNKSQIMKQAHGYIRAGLSMSDALVRAWCETKLEKIAEDRFVWLDTKDVWMPGDREYSIELNQRERALTARIVKTPAEKREEEITAEANAKAAQAAMAEWQRQEDARIERMMAQDASWAAYQKQKFAKMFA